MWGSNHLSWERAIRVDGADRLPRAARVVARRARARADLRPELIGAIGAILLPLRYYYLMNEILERQKSGLTRAEEVIEIEADCSRCTGIRPSRRSPRPRTGGAYYSEAAAQLVASLVAGTGDVQVLNVCNGGAIPNLADDDVVEVAARVDGDGAHPLPVGPLSDDMLGLVEHAKAYERLTIRAATSGDRSVALKALLSNPLVPDYPTASALLDAILDANREHLPRFGA